MSKSPATTVTTPQRGSLLAGACLLYLLLPNVLFLAGWVQPWLAWPLIVLLSFGCFHLWRRLGDVRPVHRGGRRWQLPAALLAGALAVYMIGFNGDFLQAGDFIVRNAIYDSLIREDWPLHSVRGEYFVYYHAFWLPPAFVAKFSGGVVAPWLILALWVYVGIVLFILALYRRAGRRLPGLLLLLLGVACIQEVLGRADVIARYLPVQGAVDAYYSVVPVPMRYPAVWLQLVNTFNHCIPVLLLLACGFGRVFRGTSLLLASALVVACTPLGAAALLVYLGFLLLPHLRSNPLNVLVPLVKSPLLYAELALLFLLGLYFGSGGGTGCVPAWRGDTFAGHPQELAIAYILGTLFTLLPLVFVWRFRHTSAFRTAVLVTVLFPLVWVGVDLNELQLKGILIVFFFVPVLLYAAWPYARRGKRCAMVPMLVAAAYIPFLDIQHRLREYGTSAQQHERNIQGEWQGHLNHPEHYWYFRFWGKEAPLFYKK